MDMVRFRDDALFLAKTAVGFNKLKEQMQSLAKFFILKVEEASSISVKYLDRVVKSEGDRLVTLPFLKDAQPARRLALTSAHQRAVHTSWPTMMLGRVEKLSKVSSVVRDCQDEIRNGLKKDGCFVPTENNVQRCRAHSCALPRENCLATAELPSLVA